MFFTVDRETLRWIQKTLSRTRRSGNWPALFAREACWTPAVFAALVDEHDRLLLEGSSHLACEIGEELPRLAERIRSCLCPGLALGKSSLAVWALAVAASSQRATGQTAAAEATFAAAFDKAGRGAFGWAKAELDRRFAVLLLQQKNRRALDHVTEAMNGCADYPDPLAECFILRGVCRALLDGDSSGAILDFALAASVSDPTRSERSGWSLQAASHNLALQLIQGDPCSLESLSQARKLVLHSRSFLGQGMDARKIRSWWVEGLLVYRIGWNRHGERLLERARQGFHKLGQREGFAVVTLDLVVMLLGDGETERARELCDGLRLTLQQHFAAGAAAACWLEPNLDLAKIQDFRRRLMEGLSRPASRANSLAAAIPKLPA